MNDHDWNIRELEFGAAPRVEGGICGSRGGMMVVSASLGGLLVWWIVRR